MRFFPVHFFPIRALLIPIVMAFPALLVGYLLSPHWGWAIFSSALLGQLLFHLANLGRLSQWLRTPKADANLTGGGAWEGVFSRLYRHGKSLRLHIERGEQALETLLAAAQALTDGVILLDQQNRIMFCNNIAEKQLGVALATDRGQAINNLIRQPEFVAYLQANDFTQPLVLAFSSPPFLPAVHAQHTPREENTFCIFVIPYAENSRLMQIKDVTQTVFMERMRRDFVANASHELRTPLTVLSGFLESLQEIEIPPDEQKQYLATMSEQAERMQSIVQDLLTLSSIESAPPPETTALDMAALMQRLYQDAQALSAGQHTLSLRDEGPAQLYGSESELTSAFSNLISNALRYTPEGGRIDIFWRYSDKNGESAEFVVQDSGIGIAAHHIPRLTERFYRIDKGRSRAAGGTGLGLAIVKHALNRHQAQLVINSELGKGSSFAAQFPRAALRSPSA